MNTKEMFKLKEEGKDKRGLGKFLKKEIKREKEKGDRSKRWRRPPSLIGAQMPALSQAIFLGRVESADEPKEYVKIVALTRAFLCSTYSLICVAKQRMNSNEKSTPLRCSSPFPLATFPQIFNHKTCVSLGSLTNHRCINKAMEGIRV